MDNLDFLDGAEAPVADAQPLESQAQEPVAAAEPSEAGPQAAEPSETPEQAAARVRDEKGRFKAKDSAEPVMVPLQALHETRDEVKALKARLEALQPQATPQAQQQVPDIFENPEGYQEYLQNQVNERLTNVTLNMSEAATRRAAGDELVAAAQEWGKQVLPTNPAFAQAFYGSPDPYGFLVDQFKQQTLMARVAADPTQLEAFLTWQQQGQAPQAQATQPTTQTPPRSIASATSAGGVSHVAIGPGIAFGETIK